MSIWKYTTKDTLTESKEKRRVMILNNNIKGPKILWRYLSGEGIKWIMLLTFTVFCSETSYIHESL